MNNDPVAPSIADNHHYSPSIASDVTHEEPKLSATTLKQRLRTMKGWDAFAILLIVGTIVLASPGVIITLLEPNTFPILNLGLTQLEQRALLSVKYQVVRWSFWITLTFDSYVILSYLLDSLPLIGETVVIFLIGQCNEYIRQKLNLIHILVFWIHNCLVAICAVILFRFLFFQLYEPLMTSWLDSYKFLWTIAVFNFSLLLQRLLLQNIAGQFHKVAYQERIKESKARMAVLDKLRKSIVGFGLGRVFEAAISPKKRTSEKRTSLQKGLSFLKNIKSQILPPQHVNIEIKDKEVSPMLPAVVNLEDITNNGTENLPETPILKSSNVSAEEQNLKKSASVAQSQVSFALNLNETHQIDTVRIDTDVKKTQKITLELYSDENAINLANLIFEKFQINDSITLHSFKQIFEEENQAVEAFRLFDKDGNGSITYREIKNRCKKAYREKRELTSSLVDISQALGNLNRILYILTVTITMVFILTVYAIDFSTILPFTSIFLALSFVFGGAARKAFDCIIFLFVTHPFDAGDRIIIDDGESCIVHELSILTTVLKSDGKLIYTPNDVLARKQIVNCRRSSDQGDKILVYVDFKTPEAKLKSVHDKLLEFVKSNPKLYRPSCSMDILDMGDGRMIKMRFSIDSKGNWQDGGKRWATRTKYMFALKEILINHEIEFILPTQDVRLVENK